jgi:chaperonin GroEL (HSP60 family)
MASAHSSAGGSARPAGRHESDERLAALLSNAQAVATVASAVEGTIGPKGLNCMLVDRFGDVTITNDGATILERIDVTHPASRLLINTARAQESRVGDGTTTATILAAALIAEGVAQAKRGVPITRIIEGIRLGIEEAVGVCQELARPISRLDDPLLRQAALIAGRGDAATADLIVAAATSVDREKLLHGPAFCLADLVLAREGADSEVIAGLVIDKTRMSRQMPREVLPARIALFDDALEPETVGDDALGTEAGFRRYLELKAGFEEGITRLVNSGVNCVIAQKAISETAEDAFAQVGVLAVRRVSAKDIARIAAHTGAMPLKRTALKRSAEELAAACGAAERVCEDERLGHIRIVGGGGEAAATILVGATTREVRDERERIARDSAWAVQSSLRGGVVPGGGAVEIAAFRRVRRLRETVRGMSAYGVDCVAEALKRPVSQIIANAGFNPLEKVEDAVARQASADSAEYAIDCDTGEVADMLALGVVDAAQVKEHALRAAAEAAEAILLINAVIRKREEKDTPGIPSPDSDV